MLTRLVIRVNTFAVVAAIGACGSAASAQTAEDPRAAMPERPTVATHAWTVARGYTELETGVEWDHNRDSTFAFSTPTVLKIGVARRAQLGVQMATNAATGTSLGFADAGIVIKYRFADDVPVLGAFAVLPGIKFPTGSRDHGTSTTDASLLFISSHRLGAISLDINAGYTRRSGDGTAAPKNGTVWTVSTGGPLGGAAGFAAEIFGYPPTHGPAASPGSVALLTGPTYTVRPWAVIDTGVIIRLRGDQPHALYAGLVYNFGRL